MRNQDSGFKSDRPGRGRGNADRNAGYIARGGDRNPDRELSSVGEPIYGGGEFEGGFGWSGQHPGRNLRGEASNGSDAYGYGRMGSGGRDHEDHPRNADWDNDYRHWRSQQMSKFDEDYGAWRNERRQKFSDEFDKWRQGRSGDSGNLSSGGVAHEAKEPKK